MRLLLSFFSAALLSACLHSYSSIDASDRKPFELAVGNRVARLEAPAGYREITARYSSESTLGLLELHYDFLSGTGIYGARYGETRIYIYEIRTAYSGIDEYARKSAEIKCDYLSKEDSLATCISKKNRQTRYVGQVRDGWHLFEYLPETHRMIVRDYVTHVGDGVFLNLKGVVSDRAFEREEVRLNRIQLIDDIFETLALHGPSGGEASKQ